MSVAHGRETFIAEDVGGFLSAINDQFSPEKIKILSGEGVMRIRNIINKESLDHSKNTPN